MLPHVFYVTAKEANKPGKVVEYIITIVLVEVDCNPPARWPYPIPDQNRQGYQPKTEKTHSNSPHLA